MKAIVKIQLSQYSDGNSEDARQRFWQTIVNSLPEYKKRQYQAADQCESYMSTKFAAALKHNILRDLDNQRHSIERNTLSSETQELIYRLGNLSRNSEKPAQSAEFIRAYALLIEKKEALIKELYSENTEYKSIINKHLLASQFYFSVTHIRYASLEFNLLLEPAVKVAEFCDNNFDYLAVFLNGFIAETFLEEFSTHDSNPLLNTSVNIDRSSIPTVIAPTRQSAVGQLEETMPAKEDKLAKAKWFWSLANGSLVVPVLISIFLLYKYQGNLDNIQTTKEKDVNSLLENQNKLIDKYQKSAEKGDRLYDSLLVIFLQDRLRTPNHK